MKYLTLLLFPRACSILREADASALPLTTATALPSTTATATTTTSPQSAPSNRSNTVPLAVGLTLGLLAFAALVFAGIFYLPGRRRRTPTDVGAHTVLPTTQVHPQWGPVRHGQQPSKPIRPAGVEVTMATSDPTASFGGTELGPPPSYRAGQWTPMVE